MINAHECVSIDDELVVGQEQKHLRKRDPLPGMMSHVSLVIQTAVQSLLFLHSGVVDPVETVLQPLEVNPLDDMRRVPIYVARCRSHFQVAWVVSEGVDANFEYSTQFLIRNMLDGRKGRRGRHTAKKGTKRLLSRC